MALKDGYVQGPTPPPGGWPQKPENYEAGVGSNYVGEIPGWEYSPYDDLYHPPGQKEEDGKQGLSEYLIPVAGAAGTFAVIKGLSENPTAFVKGVKDFVASGYDKIKSWFTGTPTPPATTPPVTTGSPGVTPTTPPVGAPTTLPSDIPFSLPGSTTPGAPSTPVISQAGPTEGIPGSPGAPYESGAPASFFGPSTGTVGLNSIQTLGPAAAVAAYYGPSAYEHGKPILEGNATDDDWLKGALLSNPITAWAVPIADKFGVGIGHGKNYYNAQDRDSVLTELSGGTRQLDFTKGDGTTFSLGAEDYRNNPDTYNYDQASPDKDRDIGAAHALAYLQTGDVDSTRYEQLVGALANVRKQGVSTEELYKRFGYDYNTAYQKIASDPGLKQEDKDILLNGLDQSFGTNAYQNAPKPTPTFGLGGPTPQPQAQGPAPRPAPFSMGAPGQTQTNPQQAAAWQGLVNDTTATSQGQPAPRNTAPVRVSPGVWHDDKGTYYSKTGQRGQ